MMNATTPKRMDAKFRGRCTACGDYFPAGTPILWSREAGAKHADACPAPAVGPATASAPEIPVATIAAFLTAATARGLKAPKARFLAPGGGEVRLHMAGHGTRYPGAVQVKVNRSWVGRIGADSRVAGPLASNTALLTALDVIAADPAAAAKAYGALMGACSFCGKALTDAGSVEVGYGPVCAAHYGLPHKAKGTPDLAPVVALDTPMPVDETRQAEYEAELVAAVGPEAAAEILRGTDTAVDTMRRFDVEQPPYEEGVIAEDRQQFGDDDDDRTPGVDDAPEWTRRAELFFE